MASNLSSQPSLDERFASALPKDIPFNIYHISTPPTRSPAIYSAPPGAKPERTYTESHFLAVAISASNTPNSEVLVLAIEVIIYTTKRLTTLFVSKADSTGYLSLLHLGPGYESPLRTIATTFLEFLVERRQREGKKLVLSLFARASDQYLFPGSVENPHKHVSDDRQLVKWWCRVLDPVLQKCPPQEQNAQDASGSGIASQAYLIVPGEDSIIPYLPQRVRLNTSLRQRWKHGHPLREISRHPAAPPRCLIPHFPDDPKARFLDELDDELPDNNSNQTVQESPAKKGSGQWKSVRSLEQFWEMMAFRQECSSGRLVGFLWVVFTPTEAVLESQDIEMSEPSQAASPSKLVNEGQPPKQQRRKKTQFAKKKRKPLRGPIISRTPKIKHSGSTLQQKAITSLPEETPYYLWPTSSRGRLVFTEKTYKKATDRLLALQFKNLDTAITSTKSWLEEVGVLGGCGRAWGWSVTGQTERKVEESRASEAVSNMLGVKKKRKAEDADLESVQPAVVEPNGTATVNTLGAGLVKKKKKVQPVQV